ncbi:Beta-galactosidase 15 [Glycine soja]|uniref:Beta-galactosidase 15 n=1 Tax=Glycine soja TaxID=3848 RepID=A0A0B2R0W8_GLYSO|nr:Beta-galactosidase 15 [Glycine soja]
MFFLSCMYPLGYQYSQNRQYSFTYEAKIKLKKGTNEISLLSGTIGLPNYGAHFSNVSVGVYGPVQLVALKNNTEVVKDITNNTLNYKVGLHGEIVKLYNPENNKGWNTNGLPTYRVFVWYHLPCSFIREDNQNTLVLFEEFEGHPNEVKFVTVTVDKICANSYEGNMLELSCYEEQVISKIKFASFAVPEDECGSPNALSIQSKVIY